MKRAFYLVLIGLLASLNASAQCNANNFSGNWLMKQKSSNTQQTNTEFQISVLESGKDCIVETAVFNSITKNKVITNSQVFISNTFRKKISKDNFVDARIKFINANKFIIYKTIGSPLSKSRVSEVSEHWTISDNGKKLTIESTTHNFYRNTNDSNNSSLNAFSQTESENIFFQKDTGSYFFSKKVVYIRK